MKRSTNLATSTPFDGTQPDLDSAFPALILTAVGINRSSTLLDGVALVYLPLIYDRDKLIDGPTVHFGYEVLTPDQPEPPWQEEIVLALNSRMIRIHASSTMIAGHNLTDDLDWLLTHVTNNTQTPGIDGITEAWSDRHIRGSGLVDTGDIDDSAQPALALSEACQHAGLHTLHLGRSTERSTLTATLAIALLAAAKSGWHEWRGRLDLDTIVVDAAGECRRIENSRRLREP